MTSGYDKKPPDPGEVPALPLRVKMFVILFAGAVIAAAVWSALI